MGYSPWGRRELDTTEQVCAHTHTEWHSTVTVTTDLVNADLPLPGEIRAGVLHASDHSIFI